MLKTKEWKGLEYWDEINNFDERAYSCQKVRFEALQKARISRLGESLF